MQEAAPNTFNPERPRKKKYVKYILLSIGCFLAFIFLAAILIPLLFEGQVKKIFLKEINSRIATEIIVNEDDIDLTLLKNFPEAAVVFHNIGIRESVKDSKGFFLLSDELSLMFNVRDLLKGNYIIKEIEVRNADVTLLRDEKGVINYKFWKESEEETGTDISVLLEEVKCKNVAFIYTDKKNKQDISLQVYDAELSGNFSAENYTVKASGNILSNRIQIGNTKYLINRETKTNAELYVDTKADSYTFKNGSLKVGETEFAINGSITDAKDLLFDLIVESKNADIEALLLLLPGKYASSLKNIESKGDITFQSTIAGVYSKQKKPLMQVEFSIANGTIYHKNFGDKLTNVNCTGSFTNGEKQNAQTSSVVVKQFTAHYGKDPLLFQLSYKNFANPFLELKLNGNIPAPILLASAAENITSAGGYVSFQDVSILGNIKNLNANSVKGNFSFHDVSCSVKGENIQIENGTARLENSDIVLNNFKANLFGADVYASLTLNNWLASLFSPANETNSPFNISGSLQCKTLDLNKLIETFSLESPSSTSASNDQAMRSDWMHMSGNLQCSIDAMRYKELNVTQVKADIKLSPGFIGIKNFTGNSMQGNFNVQTTFRRLANENYILEVIGILNAIHIQQLFQSFNNFNQTTLTDENIKGTATTYIENISIQWDKNFRLLENSIYSLINIKIEKGELNNYKPLESLSKFVNMTDLQNISFATMQNQIEIENSKIIIPAMQIRSSALDLDLSGTHTFSNAIDYQIELNLAELLANKFFGKNKNKEDYEQNETGGIKMYISMTGTVEKPVIKYNKREAKKKMDEQGTDKPDFLDIFKPDATEPQQKHDLFKKHEIEESSHENTDTLEFIEWEEE